MSLFDHQRAGGKWLAARARGYLGDMPGLGKTRTLISAIDRVGSRRPLIVAPAIVRTHWRREFEACGWTNGNETIVSYDAIVRGGVPLLVALVREKQIDALVLDEAHYLKNGASQRAKLLLGINGYAPRLPNVYAASGTPVPKNPSELWTTLASLFPAIAAEHKLRTFDDFVRRFCVVRESTFRGKWVERILPEVKNADEFRELLGKFMLRRTLDDVGLDVPALQWQTLRLDGNDGGLSFWGCTEQNNGYTDLRTKIDGDDLEAIARDPELARMRRRLGELKLAPTITLLENQLTDSNEKLVVFAYHRAVLEGLREQLKPFGVAYIDGDTAASGRDRAIDDFQTNPKTRVFIGQNIACQTGITLTAARRAFLVEPEWTADVNEQLGRRVARIGQTAERCIAHMICLAGSLDEAIIERNNRERRMADTIGLGDKAA